MHPDSALGEDEAYAIPSCPESEDAVIGAILRDARAADGAFSLSADDFHGSLNKTVFRALTALNREGSGVDLVTATKKLKSMGADVGFEILLSYTDKLVGFGSLDWHVSEVKKAASARAVQQALNEARRLLEEDPEAAIDNAISKLSQLRTTPAIASSFGFQPIEEITANVMKFTAERQANPDKLPGLTTGFPDLDLMTCGFMPGDLVALAARPGMGKTSLAINMISHVAVEEKIPVVLFSIEMSKEQIVRRLMVCRSQVNNSKSKEGRLNEDQLRSFTEQAARINEAPLFIADSADGISDPAAIESRLRSLLVSGVLPGLVIVDHVGLLNWHEKTENRVQEVAKISRALKRLAQELNVPILLLCQLSRALESRKDKRPMLSDLRESGSLEQDSDCVLFLYRDEVHNKDSIRTGEAELIVAKQRDGETGTVQLYWRGGSTTFLPQTLTAPRKSMVRDYYTQDRADGKYYVCRANKRPAKKVRSFEDCLQTARDLLKEGKQAQSEAWTKWRLWASGHDDEMSGRWAQECIEQMERAWEAAIEAQDSIFGGHYG